jgi:hypothetical protein
MGIKDTYSILSSGLLGAWASKFQSGGNKLNNYIFLKQFIGSERNAEISVWGFT